MACRTCPQSVRAHACARVRPPDTRLDIVPADRSVPPADTRQRLAGRRTWRTLVRPVGRTPPVQRDRLPMGTDLVRTAAAKRRTPPAPSVRLCVWSAGHGQPRGLRVLAPDRTARQCACSLRQPQPLPASGPVRRDTCTPARCRNVHKPGPPSDARGRVRRPPWTPRSDRRSDSTCPVVSGRTPSTPPGTPW
jgi:hypothetical protein